jgi:16S rRNA C1402 (ribose-2'-O) methylase RsmI
VTAQPRKRTRVEPPPPPPATPREVVEVAERITRALDALAEVHGESTLGLCRECMLPHPCHTRVIVDEAIEAVRS